MLQPPAAGATSSPSALKLEPQPHEAAALGLAIVTTEAGSARDLIDEATGRFAWLGDANNLAATIAAVFAEPGLTRERCRAARYRVERDFDIDRNVDELAAEFTA